MSRLFLMAGLLGFSGAAMAQGPQAAPAPSAKWVVSYADNQCTASRDFATADGTVGLMFRPNPTTGEMDLFFIPVAVRDRWGLGVATVTAGGQKTRSSYFTPLPTRGSAKFVFLLQLAAEEAGRLAANPVITIRGGLGKYDFQLPQFAGVVKALADCDADLLAKWGLSREQQLQQASFPKLEKHVTAYVLRTDYPAAARKARAGGEVRARVAVAADGSVSDCVVFASSGNAALDQATCAAFVKRAKLKPALDRAGRPVPSLFVFRQLWVFPYIAQ